MYIFLPSITNTHDDNKNIRKFSIVVLKLMCKSYACVKQFLYKTSISKKKKKRLTSGTFVTLV